MNSRFVGVLLLVIIAACIITGALVYPALPATLASHWDAAGRQNGAMGKLWGAFFLPLVMLVLAGLWMLLPKIDPLNKGFKGFRRVYDFSWLLITAFLAYVYALMLGSNLGWSFDISRAILGALGVLFFALGALMPYVKRNWSFGLRTPWTISSEIVWNKTHKLGGRFMSAAGLLTFVAAFLPDRRAALACIIASLAALVAWCLVYSYLQYRWEAVH